MHVAMTLALCFVLAWSGDYHQKMLAYTVISGLGLVGFAFWSTVALVCSMPDKRK